MGVGSVREGGVELRGKRAARQGGCRLCGGGGAGVSGESVVS